MIGASHPNIWKFIDSLKNEQGRNEAIIEQYIAGAELPRKKMKYMDIAVRIQKIVNEFDERNPLEYLKGIAYSL